MSSTAPPVIHRPLYVPSLEEMASVLQSGLRNDFEDAVVSVVECPDLTAKPFMLAQKGICGSPRVMDIGGVGYLFPLPQMDKVYDLLKVPSWCELSSRSALMIGAGAAGVSAVGKLAEMITNLSVDDAGAVKNQTYASKICDKDGSYKLEQISPCSECVHLMNLFISEGHPGKVLEVRASHRKPGQTHFINSLHSALMKQYGSEPVGLGGTFVLKKGKARIHVMPCYSEVPLTSDEMVDEWLKFFEMSAPLTSVGYMMSQDPGLNLRMQHFHCFSDHGDGGHFHYDVTPQDAEYVGYFNVAEHLFRVDKF